MPNIYRVTCEFYIRANNEDDVNEYLDEEAGEFAESHLIVDVCKNPEYTPYVDLSINTGKAYINEDELILDDDDDDDE